MIIEIRSTPDNTNFAIFINDKIIGAFSEKIKAIKGIESIARAIEKKPPVIHIYINKDEELIAAQKITDEGLYENENYQEVLIKMDINPKQEKNIAAINPNKAGIL